MPGVTLVSWWPWVIKIQYLNKIKRVASRAS